MAQKNDRCSWCGGKLRRAYKRPTVGTCCDKRGAKIKGRQARPPRPRESRLMDVMADDASGSYCIG